MFVRFAFVLSLLVCVAGLAQLGSAQEIPEKAQQLFDRLAGEWEAVTTVGEKSMTAKLTSKRTPNNEGTVWYWSGTDIDSGQVSSAAGLMGWDGQQGMVVETMISTNGVTLNATWSGAGNRWVSPTRSMEFMDGEYKTTYLERVIEWKSDDEFTVISRNRLLAGKPQEEAKTVVKRLKTESPALDLERDFGWLIGNWRGEFEVDRDVEAIGIKKGQVVQEDETYSWGLDRKFIVYDRTYSIDGKSVGSATDFIGYDAKSKTIKQWGFYSTGGNGSGLWRRVDPSSLEMVWSTIDADGKQESGRYIQKKVDKDAIENITVDRQFNGEKLPDTPKTMSRRVN